jgi:hypothetical protein
MKPLNANDQGCDPVSSNCIIWQGPDIECISLCKGDSISVVIHALATELCSVLDSLDIENYDLSCFDLAKCADNPTDFQSLIQFLIDKICELQNIDPAIPVTPTGCPDCIVDIAECFYYTNPQGDRVTTMQLVDYVTAIANRVCTIVAQIETIKEILSNHEERIKALENRKDPEFNLPSVTPICVIDGGAPVDPIVLLQALESAFCNLVSSTGSYTDLFTAVATQCINDTDKQLSNVSQSYSTIPGWIPGAITVADSINNIWLVLCDLYQAVYTIQETCCPTVGRLGCSDIILNFNGVVESGNLNLNISGTIPTGFQETGGSTLISISDGTNSISQYISLVVNLNQTVSISLSGLNTSNNLTVQIPTSFYTNEGTVCESYRTFTIDSSALCPFDLVFTAITQNAFNYSFTYIGGAANVKVEVLDPTGPAYPGNIVYTQNQNVTSTTYITGTVSPAPTGLAPGKQYEFVITITNADSDVPTACPKQIVTTLSNSCVTPAGITVTTDQPNFNPI